MAELASHCIVVGDVGPLTGRGGETRVLCSRDLAVSTGWSVEAWLEHWELA
jgi:hypothetical protein